MYRMKRFLALSLAVCLLSCSVASVKVEAAEIVVAGGITAATVFDICLFIGAIGVGCYAVGEIIDNREEIATFGKNLIDSISLDDVPDGWLFEFMDSETGQEYVVGSEVIDYIQSCVWLGILGAVTSGGGDQEPEEDPDNDKKDWFKFASPSSMMYGSFTALGATWLIDSLSKLYQKWVNGEELTEAEQAVLAPVIEGYCDQYDIAKQWSGETFHYSAELHDFFTIIGDFNKGANVHMMGTLDMDNTQPLCGFFREINNTYELGVYVLDAYGNAVPASMDYVSFHYQDGELLYKNVYSDRGGLSFGWDKVHSPHNVSYSANFPVFSSKIEAEAYLKGIGAVTDALNYAKTYQNADWLSDDWKGLLIDPLTNIGLSLSQLTDLAKALGVHAVGNNLSAQELADLLKQSLPAVNPDLLPDAVPVSPTVPNPDLDPIYYPYPNAHPLPTPGTRPDPDPGTDPTPGTDPDVDMSSYKVDLQGIFPFCIPFDFIALLKVLDTEPVAPCFDFPVVIPALGYEETVRLDMSIFDDVAEVMRLCETVSFIIFLMFATSKVIKW